MKNRSRARVRRGYLAAAAVLALGLAAALNLLVSRVPASAREVDLTDNGLYNISDTSREFLAELEQDVEIAVLAEEGEMDRRIALLRDDLDGLTRQPAPEERLVLCRRALNELLAGFDLRPLYIPGAFDRFVLLTLLTQQPARTARYLLGEDLRD